MDVLCSDKTGTLTRNELKVTAVRPMPGFDAAHVLSLAALACSEGGADSVDAAIRAAAAKASVAELPVAIAFVPFDPKTKMSEATVVSGHLTVAGVGIGLGLLAFCSAVLAFGTFRLHLASAGLQTLSFVTVAFASQATIYAIRERCRLTPLRPSRWLVLSSAGDLSVSALLAGFGILMTPLSWAVIGEIFGAAAAFGIVLNFIKLPLLGCLKLS